MIEEMAEVIEKSEQREILTPENVEEIRNTAYKLHSVYNEEIWKDKKSFHNEEHIRAVGEASDKLFDSAIEGNDPLNLEGEMIKWNLYHKDSEIKDLNQLKQIAQIAFAAHDWGNIMHDIEIDENGEINPVYIAEGYTAAGAELRSQGMFEKYINSLNLSDDVKRTYVNVGKEIIWQTVYNPENNDFTRPFARFSRIVDQIGNDVLSKNDERVEGLLMEMTEEDERKQSEGLPTFPIAPDNFINFARVRGRVILNNNEAQLASIYEIWGAGEPEETAFHEHDNLSSKEMLKAVQDRNAAKKIFEDSGYDWDIATQKINEAGLGHVISEPMRSWEEIKPANSPRK